MRTTKTLLGAKARKAVLDGVNAIYEPVRKTFGPEGRNALLYRTFNRGSRVTNDGFTVAEVQEPKDVFVRLAAATFKESCKRTNERVGDGTTCTAILGGKLMNDVYALLSQGSSSYSGGMGKMGVMTLKKKILESAEKVKEAIKQVAKKVESLEEMEKIAIVSVEDVELGKIIAKMAWEVGTDGFLDVVEGYKGEIETEIIKGARFPAKVAAKGFVNNQARYEMVATDVAVIVTNYSLNNVWDASGLINPILESKDGSKKIALIAPDFSNDVLTDMWKGCNQIVKGQVVKTGIEIYPIKVPSLRTEQFEDISIYFGTKFIDKQKGMKLRLDVSEVGFAEKIVVKDTEAKEDAIALGGKGTQEVKVVDVSEEEVEVEKKGKKVKELQKSYNDRITTRIAERIATLKTQLEETREEQFKKLLERRIASMASAVGVIRVGDTTQASSLYRKLKIEDAVYACKAALRGGYVRGGGLCLKEIAESLPEDDIIRSCLLAPYEQIQSSVDGGIEIGEDILDPAEAIYYAVEHATQVVANLATVEIITPEVEDPIHGEGEQAIAKALMEMVVSQKINYGQLKENEAEMWKDKMGGLTIDEAQTLDNG